MAKQPIPQIEQLSEESKKLFDVLNRENDLSVILVATSFLDASLASILERKFIHSSVTDRLLDARRGALGSLAVRTDVCYALGLIKKPLYADLSKIAEIRNMVAHHHLFLNFQTKGIAKLCGELSYVGLLKDGASKKPLDILRLMKSPRNQFVLTATMISQRLLLIATVLIVNKILTIFRVIHLIVL